MAYALIRKFNETPFRLSETPPRSSGTCRSGLRWLYSFDVCERFRRTVFTFVNESFTKVNTVQAPTWAFIVPICSGTCRVVHKRQNCTSDRRLACTGGGAGSPACTSDRRPACLCIGSRAHLHGRETGSARTPAPLRRQEPIRAGIAATGCRSRFPAREGTQGPEKKRVRR